MKLFSVGKRFHLYNCEVFSVVFRAYEHLQGIVSMVESHGEVLDWRQYL
jgi:hypothetical protein